VTWIDSFLERLKALWPFKRVAPWERAVRITYWHLYLDVDAAPAWTQRSRYLQRLFSPIRQSDDPRIELLKPGIRSEVWFYQEIFEGSVVQQVIQLPTQSVTTEDGVSVTFDATITFEVVDLVQKVTQVHDFDHSLINLAMMHLSAKVREVTWEFLRSHQAGLERNLRRSLDTKVAPWGVKIIKVGLTGMVQARQYRIYSDSYLLH
jgi:regulator of protease activity HflC (stomatin/prohibitin superfamily)